MRWTTKAGLSARAGMAIERTAFGLFALLTALLINSDAAVRAAVTRSNAPMPSCDGVTAIIVHPPGTRAPAG